jgi:aryl-alcohol dehydrogenase-like predicted oxidoreductase
MICDGVSNFSQQTLEIARETGVQVMADEFAFNLISRGPERELLPYCEKTRLTFIIDIDGTLSVAWLCQKPAMVSIIADCRTAEQLRENTTAVETKLPPEPAGAHWYL